MPSDDAPDRPTVTPAMIAAGLAAIPPGALLADVLAAVYRAMRLARPLAEGPGV